VKNRNTIRKALVLLAACTPLCLPGLADAGVLSPFSAVYEVTRDGMSLGHARFSLSADGGNCYAYKGVADPEGLAALLIGRSTEESHFCLQNGRLRSQSYSTSREGGGSKDNYRLSFDWTRGLVSTGNGEPRQLPEDAVDSIAMHIAIRKAMQETGGSTPDKPILLSVVDDDGVRQYSFAASGHEPLKTALGNMDTVLVERINTKRKIRFWLAPSLDYLPVKFEQQKKDDPPIRMNLESLPRSPSG
jgi:hypothetical protein